MTSWKMRSPGLPCFFRHNKIFKEVIIMNKKHWRIMLALGLTGIALMLYANLLM